MRPTLDWNPGIRDSRAAPTSARGTALPQADTGSFDEFFQAGDEGRYEGGPADFEPIELDEPQPLKIIVRTPEQVARRARFIKAVSMVVGCFAAITAVAFLRSSTATASQSAEAPAVTAVAAPAIVTAPEPALIREPKVEPAAPPSVEPILPDPQSVKPSSTPEPIAKPRPVVAVRPRAVAQPAPQPERAPARAPITVSGPPPTASFPAM
jgi:hypothetical protein